MSRFIKLSGTLSRLLLVVGFIFTSLIPVRSWVSAQSSSSPLWIVRSLYTSEYGIDEPKGLAFSSIANTFLILDETGNIALVAMGEDNEGTRVLSEVQDDPLNAAFDEQMGSLFVFKRGKAELVKIKADGKGLLDASAPSTHFAANAFGIKDPQGISFDLSTGRLFILDAGTSQIVSVVPHPTLGFDANEAIRANKVERISLKKLGTGLLRGIAYNPGNGHLFVSEPAQKKLYELTQSGDLVSMFDLASVGINHPSAMTFAPSADTTDDPNIYDLFLLDTHTVSSRQAAASDSQVVELSLLAPASLPPGTPLLPSTLVRTFDTSNKAWNPSSPDPSGVDYWPLTGRLLIDDSEVDEMSNYFTGKNVYDATLSGTLVSTCSTTNLSRTGFSNEPTGVGINRNNNRIYFSDDDANKINEVSLGADSIYCTSDDIVTSVNVGTVYNIQDAEDVAYGNNTIFVGGGTDAEVYRIPLGPNGVLGGGDDGPMTHFDTAALGFHDLEGIGYNWDSGTLFIVSTQGSERYLGETSTTGTLLHAYDLSFMGTAGNIRSDVTYAPGSQSPAVKNIYIVSRGVDNDKDPKENDGKAWEINISGSGTSVPSQTPVNTNTPTPTFTPGPSPTPTNTPPVTDLIFRDGFDESGDLSRWTSNVNDSGDLRVSTAAALVGSQGMQAVIDDANPLYVTDDSPSAEPHYRARFYFDPNSIPMASGDAHFMFKGFMGTSTNVLQLEFRFSSGAYQLRAGLLNDSSVWVNTNWFTISDVAHFIELDWRAATAVGTNDGGLTLWIDGAQQANLTGVDNDTWRLDRARLGALSGIDAGTRGTYYFDAFESRRQTYIGP